MVTEAGPFDLATFTTHFPEIRTCDLTNAVHTAEPPSRQLIFI